MFIIQTLRRGAAFLFQIYFAKVHQNALEDDQDQLAMTQFLDRNNAIENKLKVKRNYLKYVVK